MARGKPHIAILTMLGALWGLSACSSSSNASMAAIDAGLRDSKVGGGDGSYAKGDASTAISQGGTSAIVIVDGEAMGGGGAPGSGGAMAAGGSNNAAGGRTGAGSGTSGASSGGVTGLSSPTNSAGGATSATGWGGGMSGSLPGATGAGGIVSPSGGTAKGGAAAAGGAVGQAGMTSATGTTRSGGASSGGGATRAGGSGVASPDAGLLSPDAPPKGDGTDCAFTGGSVTAALFPNGLTLRKVCSPYSVGNINISDEGVLTIEPGVTLRFAMRTALSVGLRGSGKLWAVGTTADPIVFTSQESLPSRGFWDGLVFSPGTVSGSNVSYAQVTAAGGNQDACILGATNLPGSAVTFDHLTVDKVGDGSDGILALGDKSNIAITNSTFVDIPQGRYPISVLAASFVGIGAGNTYPAASAVEVAGGTVDTTVGWTNPGIPLAITKDVVVEGTGNPVLTVGPGTMLKFGAGVALQVGRAATGKIVIAGTTASPVLLTALNDAPQPGAWAGVEIWDNGKATISYADFQYGGSNTGDSKGNLTLESAAATVQLAVDHSTFKYSNGWGIYVPCASGSQNAIITVDANTTYLNNALGAKGPGLIGSNCP